MALADRGYGRRVLFRGAQVRVICAWHKPAPLVYAETCPTLGCGQRATALPILGVAFCINPDCPTFLFEIGEGGDTHGICRECKDDLMRSGQSAALEPGMLHEIANTLQAEFDRLENRA
jgi:hypothetical protein